MFGGDVVDQYADDDEPSGNFEQYTVFAYDQFYARTVFGVTVPYVALLAIYTAYHDQIPEDTSNWLIRIGIALLLGSILTLGLVYITYEKDNYQPETYFWAFHTKGRFVDKADDDVQKTAKGQYRFNRLSVPRFVLIVEIGCLLTAVCLVFLPYL